MVFSQLATKFTPQKTFDESRKKCVYDFNGSRNLARSLAFEKWLLLDTNDYFSSTQKLEKNIYAAIDTCSNLFLIKLDSSKKESICKSCALEAQRIVSKDPKISKKQFAQNLYYHMQDLILSS